MTSKRSTRVGQLSSKANGGLSFSSFSSVVHVGYSALVNCLLLDDEIEASCVIRSSSSRGESDHGAGAV